MNTTGNFRTVFAPLLAAMLCASAVCAQTWEPMTCPVSTPLKGIWGTASDNIYAVGSAGVILHYNGSSWNQVANLSLTETLSGIHGSSATNIVAVGENGIVAQYNGSNWSKRYVTASTNLNAVWVASPSRMFIVGENGVILDCDQATCSQMNYTTTYSLNGVWGAAANNVYAVGAAGTIIHFDGTQWTAMQSSVTDILHAVWGISATDVYAAGDSGIILHYNGTVWTPMKVIKRDYYAVGGIAAPYRVYAAGKDGKISYYDKSAWADMTSGVTKALQGIWVSPTNEAFIVGAGGVILRYAGETIPENTAPKAAFSVTVATDNPLTVYVDASASTDIQTATDDLDVQWDWESDGTFDTQYNTAKIASHTYAAAGTYTITLRVRDAEGLTGTASQEVVLQPAEPGQCPARQVLGDDDPATDVLCRFRDTVLARSSTGRLLVDFYYRHAETLSGALADNPRLAAFSASVVRAIIPPGDTDRNKR